MRTTLTLDPDVVRLLEDAVHRERRPTKQVVNDALRRGLGSGTSPRTDYSVTPHTTTLQPGIDAARLNQLVDAFEDDALLDRTAE